MGMRAISTILLVCACALTNVLGNPVDLDVFESWGNQFKARFCLTAPHVIYGGWKIKLSFSAPVDSIQIWDAKYLRSSVNKKKYVLGNENWNQMWPANETKCMELIGQDANIEVTGTAEFLNLQAPEVCEEKTTGQNFDINIGNHWDSGLQADFCLTVPKDMDGWTIKLEFSKKIPSLTVWGASAVKLDAKKRVWLLSNRNHNSQLMRGSRHCISFVADTKGKFMKPCIDAYFVNEDMTPIEGDAQEDETAAPPQTQGPQTQGPQTQGPQTKGPQTQGPQTQGPQTQGPQTQGPQTPSPPSDDDDDNTPHETTRSPRSSNKNQAVLNLFNNVFDGEGTYYGAQLGGTCTYGNTLPPAARSPKIDALVALNAPQFMSSLTCGLCLRVTGKGDGLGSDPIVGTKIVFTKDLCPECHVGDVDLAVNGDGRWKIQIQAVQCPVADTKLSYAFQGSNPWYIKLQVRNARIPITALELQRNGAWINVNHSPDGYWVISDGHEWPTTNINVRLTAANGQVLTDTIPKLDNTKVMDGLKKVQVSLDPHLPNA